jgi:hypothetical protein
MNHPRTRIPRPRRPGPRPHLPALVPGLVLAAACAVAVLSACGSQVAGQSAGTAGTTVHTASPRQRADADAARIIAGFPRPARAVRTGPIASLTVPGEGPEATPDVATATRWWRVPGRPQSVLAWIAAHLPAGFTAAGSGSGGYMPSPSVTLPQSWTHVFALAPVPGVLTHRLLVVLAVPYRGQTALRTDAQVTWLPPRPAAERIPPGVRAVAVTPVFGLNPDARRDRLDHAFTVTGPATVARIVALADALAVYPPGVRSCPADFGGAMRLAFLARAGGPVLARFTAAYGGCGAVSVSIGGQNRPALSDWTAAGQLFQDRVLAIAGVRWPHQPGAPG